MEIMAARIYSLDVVLFFRFSPAPGGSLPYEIFFAGFAPNRNLGLLPFDFLGIEIFLRPILVTWLLQVSRELDRSLIIDTRRRNVYKLALMFATWQHAKAQRGSNKQWKMKLQKSL